MSVSRPVPVALFGLGGVGKAILTQLLSPPLNTKFQLVYIANSRLSLSLPLPNSASLTPANFLPILEKYGAPLDLPSVISVLSNHPDGPSVFVDATASESIPSLFPQILSMGISVVTANKKGTSSSETLYKSIQQASSIENPQGGMYYGESTVGAGLPILSSLKDLVATGDDILKVEGVFSGTLSYIFNEFSKVEGGDVKFSEVVKVAKDLGYTEPDPRDDLSGTDVARKLAILSRLIPTSPSLPDGFASIPTESLVPPVLADAESKEDYLNRLAEGDEYFDNLREEARKEGNVVRYVGVVDVKNGKVEAKLGKYPFDHAFATALKGSDNIVSFNTKRYSPRPLIIQGAGAGADVTAMGVTSDLVKVHERLTTRRA